MHPTSGNVLERYKYDPYGNVTVLNADGTERGDGTAASSFFGWVYLHQGLRLSTAIGLYDDRNRIYDPTLGRFLEEDPAGFADGSSQYQAYVSNPISFVDPNGLWHGGNDGDYKNGPDGPQGTAVADANDTLTGLATLITGNADDSKLLKPAVNGTVDISPLLKILEEKLRKNVVAATTKWAAIERQKIVVSQSDYVR